MAPPFHTLSWRSMLRTPAAGRRGSDTEISIQPLGGGAPLPPGERGEVCIRGPQVMRGYAHRPEATAEAIDADGWFHTGDVGVLDEDGYLAIVDRTKDMLLYKGYNVYPRELEELLHARPGVIGAAVVGRPDPVAGELPVAFVVADTRALAQDAAERIAERLHGGHRDRSQRRRDVLVVLATTARAVSMQVTGRSGDGRTGSSDTLTARRLVRQVVLEVLEELGVPVHRVDALLELVGLDATGARVVELPGVVPVRLWLTRDRDEVAHAEHRGDVQRAAGSRTIADRDARGVALNGEAQDAAEQLAAHHDAAAHADLARDVDEVDQLVVAAEPQLAQGAALDLDAHDAAGLVVLADRGPGRVDALGVGVALRVRQVAQPIQW